MCFIFNSSTDLLKNQLHNLSLNSLGIYLNHVVFFEEHICNFCEFNDLFENALYFNYAPYVM